jgi:hypothetical protein
MPIPNSLAIHIKNNIFSVILSKQWFHYEQTKEFDPFYAPDGPCKPYRQVGMMSFSRSRDHRDHSSWIAVMGCTACALRMVDAEASESPRYLTLPSSTSFFISPTYQEFGCIKIG